MTMTHWVVVVVIALVGGVGGGAAYQQISTPAAPKARQQPYCYRIHPDDAFNDAQRCVR